MKLIFCPSCSDVVALRARLRTCYCGKSRGRYTDNIHAEVDGEAVPLFFENARMRAALNARKRINSIGLLVINGHDPLGEITFGITDDGVVESVEDVAENDPR